MDRSIHRRNGRDHGVARGVRARPGAHLPRRDPGGALAGRLGGAGNCRPQLWRALLQPAGRGSMPGRARRSAGASLRGWLARATARLLARGAGSLGGPAELRSRHARPATGRTAGATTDFDGRHPAGRCPDATGFGSAHLRLRPERIAAVRRRQDRHRRRSEAAGPPTRGAADQLGADWAAAGHGTFPADQSRGEDELPRGSRCHAGHAARVRQIVARQGWPTRSGGHPRRARRRNGRDGAATWCRRSSVGARVGCSGACRGVGGGLRKRRPQSSSSANLAVARDRKGAGLREGGLRRQARRGSLGCSPNARSGRRTAGASRSRDRRQGAADPSQHVGRLPRGSAVSSGKGTWRWLHPAAGPRVVHPLQHVRVGPARGAAGGRQSPGRSCGAGRVHRAVPCGLGRARGGRPSGARRGRVGLSRRVGASGSGGNVDGAGSGRRCGSRHRRWSPPRGRAAARGAGPELRGQRLQNGGRQPHLAAYGSEHGGQVDLPAPSRPHRAHGAGRFVRARKASPNRSCGQAVQPYRRLRRFGRRPLDVPGRNAGNGGHPYPGDGAVTGDP